MIVLVEKQIATIISSTKGAIFHDGLNFNGVHFSWVFASFMLKVRVLQNGIEREVNEQIIPLISVSSLASSENDTDKDRESSDTESTTFDALSHVHLLKNIFHFFSIDYHHCVLVFDK